MRLDNLEYKETTVKGCYEIIPDKYGDYRGSFQEKYQIERYKKFGFNLVYQSNESESCKGTFRGLHFQKPPFVQTKIVRVTKGSVIDFVVDLREDSPTYKQYYYALLSAEANNQLYVPKGCAHGFLALEDAKFEYLVDNPYAPKFEGGILYNDPEIGIPLESIMKQYGIEKPILSPKDLKLDLLKNTPLNFKENQDKYLITGYNGQLGYDMKKTLLASGIKEENILATTRYGMDITNQKQVREVVSAFHPNTIFHCAAWTAVDKAETSKEAAKRVNIDGTRNIALAANDTGAKLVYLSTDYVFDGTKNGIYLPTDQINPINYYGETKAMGEEIVRATCARHFINRTSWVFGINGNNFVRAMLNMANNPQKDPIKVVNDQIGSPTYSVDLANKILLQAQTDNYGTYHITNSGFCSWAEFAKYIFEASKHDSIVEEVSTEEFYRGKNKAPRPFNSRLDMTSFNDLGLGEMPTWQDAVDRYLNELNEYKEKSMVYRRF